MGEIIVTINDWAKFNPRSDRANYSWFRLENTFFTKTFSWGASSQRLFLYLCSCASQQNKPQFKFDIDLAIALLKDKKGQILSNLNNLKHLGIVEMAVSRHDAGKEPSLLPATYVRTNETNETNNIGQNKFDLESLYSLFPRKIKKKKGIEKLHQLIKSSEDFDKVRKSIVNYSDYCSKNVSESKYIMHFTTFVSAWEDWLEPKTEFSKSGKTDIAAILRGEA